MSGKEPEAVAGQVVAATGAQVKYSLKFVSRESLRILFAFLLIVLPLTGFAALVEELREGGVFFFDEPVMVALHKLSSTNVDFFFVTMSKLGYQWGVIPLDVVIAAWLLWKRRYRDLLFFGLAVVGSLLVNLGTKSHFARIRPDLWASIAPEMTYSFPSGHAMGSATLATALILLAWPTPRRWLVACVAIVFVLLVGMSRVYLGVHWPSDILAGWTAASAWVLAMHWLVASRAPPPSPAAAPAKPDAIAQSKTAQKAVAEGRKPG